MKDDDAMFYNNASRKVLDIRYKEDVIERLKAIKIFEGEDVYSNFYFNEKVNFVKSNSVSLYKYCKDIEHQGMISNEEDYFQELYNLKGEMQLNNGEDVKSFSIQIGTIYWKDKKSVIMIINDVSQMKNHFKVLDNYKDSLLATVSHDLRTPLNGILGILEVLNDEIEEPIKKEKLLISISASRLLLNMINDILDFSLISKGRLRLKFDSTNISSLIEETANILKLQASMKGIKLEVQNHISSTENILVDGNRLKQVLLNLIVYQNWSSHC